MHDLAGPGGQASVVHRVGLGPCFLILEISIVGVNFYWHFEQQQAFPARYLFFQHRLIWGMGPGLSPETANNHILHHALHLKQRLNGAEPRTSPRQLKHVNFAYSEKISGDLSDLERLTHLGWTPLGQSGWPLGVGCVGAPG